MIERSNLRCKLTLNWHATSIGRIFTAPNPHQLMLMISWHPASLAETTTPCTQLAKYGIVLTVLSYTCTTCWSPQTCCGSDVRACAVVSALSTPERAHPLAVAHPAGSSTYQHAGSLPCGPQAVSSRGPATITRLSGVQLAAQGVKGSSSTSCWMSPVLPTGTCITPHSKCPPAV
jgi:hypothetical protein